MLVARATEVGRRQPALDTRATSPGGVTPASGACAARAPRAGITAGRAGQPVTADPERLKNINAHTVFAGSELKRMNLMRPARSQRAHEPAKPEPAERAGRRWSRQHDDANQRLPAQCSEATRRGPRMQLQAGCRRQASSHAPALTERWLKIP